MVPPVSFDRRMTTRTFVVQMQPFYQSRLRQASDYRSCPRWQLDRNFIASGRVRLAPL
jgi:hypothetical protein